MKIKVRGDLTPQGYIRRMFAESENGMVTVCYEDPDNLFAEEERTFELNWTQQDAEALVQKYNVLVCALARIGKLHPQLNDEESRRALLSKTDLEVWSTYVRPFEPIKVNWDELHPLPSCEDDELISLIYSIYDRSQFESLTEQEELLLKKYYMWREEQSQKRIPFSRRSCVAMIERAMRYESFISLGAPEIVVLEEGRCLAEEMALYYFGKEEPIILD